MVVVEQNFTMQNKDEWYTPKELYLYICKFLKLTPKLDVCATKDYHLCEYFFTKEDDALKRDWLIKAGTKKTSVWCNPPGSQIQEFIDKAHEQWIKHDINIIMLIPTNSISNKGFEKIWNTFLNYTNIQIYPLFGVRPRFLDGRENPSKPKVPKLGSRNGYIVLVFRKSN